MTVNLRRAHMSTRPSDDLRVIASFLCRRRSTSLLRKAGLACTPVQRIQSNDQALTPARETRTLERLRSSRR
jgi:hypothetical protein